MSLVTKIKVVYEDVNLMITGFFCYILGMLTVFLPKRREIWAHYLAQGATILGSICVFMSSVTYLLTDMSCPQSICVVGNFSLAMDSWNAVFLAITGLGGIITGVYGLGYGIFYQGNRLRMLSSLFTAFVFSMVLVPLAQDALGFLLAWEIMAVVSFLLVNHEAEKKGVWQIAYQYLVMTHLGTAAIMIAFLVVGSGSPDLQFSSLAMGTLDGGTRDIAFLAAFIGFALKAGLVPLHVWLPNAHPAAPSHVSALMSGVMLNMALCGFGRFIFSFLGPIEFWWGLLVFSLALISAFAGALYAQMATDMKRILAYSSVENMGIVFVGMGTGMLLLTTNQQELAMLGFVAAIVHAFNHSIMKTLLFMSAGSIMQGMSGEKNIEKMGGLGKFMPKTALFTLIGVMGLAALPLTSGFVGEWLTFKSLLHLVNAQAGTGFRLLAAFGFVSLGLTAALALGAFVRFYGIIFLGRPRTNLVEKAHELSVSMLIAMGISSFLVITMGVFCAPIVELAIKVMNKTLVKLPALTNNLIIMSPTNTGTGIYAPLALAVLLVILGVILYGVIYKKNLLVKSDVTWNCGTVSTNRQQYSATGFSKPVRRAFGAILKPIRQKSYLQKSHDYFGREVLYKLSLPDRFTDNLYQPLQHWLVKAAAFLRQIQTGSVRLYVGYVMVAMILVLIWGAMYHG